MNARRRWRRWSLGIVCCLIFAASLSAQTPPWAIPAAPYRAPVRLQTPPNDPDAGILVDLPEFGQVPAQGVVNPILTDAAGKPLPLAVAGMTPGKTLLLLAKELPAGADAFVYFGGSRPQPGPGWQPKISLLLETRRLPIDRLKFDVWPDARDAWQRASGTVDGLGFVPGIYHGANPFGTSAGFISHYTGYLLPSAGKNGALYTMSSDASFVLVNDQYFFGWPGKHLPDANAKNVQSKSIAFSSAGATKIDYYQAKFSDGAPAAVLGWQRGGDNQPIPAEAWMHPGAAEVRAVEEMRGYPVPLARVMVKSYIGIEEQFYYETRFSLPRERLDGWTVEWQFDDGATFTGHECTRLLPDAAPRGVTVRLRRGADELRGLRRWEYVDPLPAASINHPPDRERYLSLLDKETAARLPAAELRADILFMRDYADDRLLAEFGQAWLQKGADSKDPLWAVAKIAALRALAQTNPAQALAEYRRLDARARADHAREFDVFEMEFFAFCLRDPAGVAQIKQAGFRNPNTDLARLSDIRVGDLLRLLDRLPEAQAQYRRAEGVVTPEEARRLPAQARAYSIDIDGSLSHGDRLFARQKLDEWELRHPSGKYENDFLLLRARVLMAYARWSEGLTELDSFMKIQPDNPYQIDADFYRARACYELGRKDEARKLWQGIADKYPRHELAKQSREWARK